MHSHNGYLHEYGYRYEIDIYPAGSVYGYYYSYLICAVDIQLFNCKKNKEIQNYKIYKGYN